MVDRLWVLLATGLHISYIPVTLTGGRKWTGAGFLGTVLGAAFVPVLPEGRTAYAVFLALSVWAACWICGKAERILGGHDDSRIVLDEVVGYWTAIAFLPWTPRVLLAAFVLFRIFDACKLEPYRRLEGLPGGYGVVMDDVGAGVVANLLVRLAIFLKPGLLA